MKFTFSPQSNFIKMLINNLNHFKDHEDTTGELTAAYNLFSSAYNQQVRVTISTESVVPKTGDAAVNLLIDTALQPDQDEQVVIDCENALFNIFDAAHAFDCEDPEHNDFMLKATLEERLEYAILTIGKYDKHFYDDSKRGEQ